jgi:hypothetical protein
MFLQAGQLLTLGVAVIILIIIIIIIIIKLM